MAKRGGKRHSPEQIVQKLRDGDAMLNAAFTMAEYAAAISTLSGKAIPYVNLPQESYQNALVGAGLPELFAAILADADAGIAKGQLFDEGRQLSQLIGKPTTSLESVIKRALNY